MQPSHAVRPTSLPHYAPLQLDAHGAAHLLIAQANALDRHAAFAGQLMDRAHATSLVLGEPGHLKEIVTQCYANERALEQAVRQYLADAEVGLRAYLCGDEAFVWRMRRLLTESGMRGEEIHSTAVGARRAVYCVHCGAVHDYLPEDEVDCAGCGLRLAVRQHFSPLLGAYFGGCANPDAPFAGSHA